MKTTIIIISFALLIVTSGVHAQTTEVDLRYDILPGVDQQAYAEWAKMAIGLVLQAKGVVEFRGRRNTLGSPTVKATSEWKSIADWANFVESEGWKMAMTELRAKFAANIRIEIWEPSPLVPKPLKPRKAEKK
jgi:hypothetical protein